MRILFSAKLLLNGTSTSFKKRNVSSSKSDKRSSKFRAFVCLTLPRFLTPSFASALGHSSRPNWRMARYCCYVGCQEVWYKALLLLMWFTHQHLFILLLNSLYSTTLFVWHGYPMRDLLSLSAIRGQSRRIATGCAFGFINKVCAPYSSTCFNPTHKKTIEVTKKVISLLTKLYTG